MPLRSSVSSGTHPTSVSNTIAMLNPVPSAISSQPPVRGFVSHTRSSMAMVPISTERSDTLTCSRARAAAGAAYWPSADTNSSPATSTGAPVRSMVNLAVSRPVMASAARTMRASTSNDGSGGVAAGSPPHAPATRTRPRRMAARLTQRQGTRRSAIGRGHGKRMAPIATRPGIWTVVPMATGVPTTRGPIADGLRSQAASAVPQRHCSP
jgi:hypothetical protein